MPAKFDSFRETYQNGPVSEVGIPSRRSES
jgi:hypothetical protein